MSDNLVSFPKTLKKIDRIRKKIPFRFDPLPALIIDEWLPHLNLAEIRCILYICRRTWGWRKEWDAISMSQFVSGIVDRNGKHVDYGVGLCESHVRRTLSKLEAKGLIEINHRKTKAHLYKLTIFRGVQAYTPQASQTS